MNKDKVLFLDKNINTVIEKMVEQRSKRDVHAYKTLTKTLGNLLRVISSADSTEINIVDLIKKYIEMLKVETQELETKITNTLNNNQFKDNYYYMLSYSDISKYLEDLKISIRPNYNEVKLSHGNLISKVYRSE